MSKILRLFSERRPQFLAVFAVLFSCVFMIFGDQIAYATGPGVINFQGKVVNTDGTNVTNGAYNFDFVMYDDPTAGTNRWQELTKSVTVTNGVFQTNLGSATALPNFNTYPALYLAVRFNADAAGYMTPRVQMSSVPYALNADNLGGIASSGFVQFGATQSGNINISSGTITSGLINGQTVSSSANFTGTLAVTTSIATPLLDTATAVPLDIGTNNASVINLNENATIAANKSFTANGDAVFKDATNSLTAFQIQNTAGSDIFNVDTTDANLVTNPGFEVNATSWVAANTTAPTRVTTSKYLGFASGVVTSVTSAGEGFKQVLATTLANGTYTVSWSDKLVSGPAFIDVMAAYSVTGGAAVDCTAINSQTVVSTGWTRHWCQITVAGANSSNFLTIRQVGASASRTWNIDAVQLEAGSTATAYGAGTIAINSNITSPINFKNIEDSTTAFQVQSTDGTNVVSVDTLNKALTLNGQSDLRFADSDSSNWVAFQAPTAVTANVTWTLPAADAAGCLQSNGSGVLSFAACGDTDIQTFSANGTFNLRPNALMVIIEAWGGGGGGGGGTGNSLAAVRSGGAGGGGGAYTTSTIAASSLGATVAVTIGAGGTAGTGGTTAVGTAGGNGGTTCFSTTTACAGTMYLQTFGGGGGGGISTAGNGGGGGGGTQSTAASIPTTAAGAVGGSPLGALATLMNSGSGGAGGGSSSGAGGSGNWGGGGGGASHISGAANSGAGGGSNQGGAGGGGGASCATPTCTLRSGGTGGHVPGLSGGGGTAGVSAGQAGGAGSAGVGSGGDGGGGGANITTVSGTGGTGGAGGTRGGGGGGGGASANTGTQVGGAGGAGGAGYLRTWTLRGAGADLAEIYCTNDPSLTSGDVVAIDPELRAGVRKTVVAYDHAAIGIISTSPGLVTGNIEEECAKPVLVALAGRVPLKVSLENGPIKSGDSLTASSTPGVAMKAVKAGTVIGQALTAYDGSQPEGYIVAFVQNSESNGTTLTDLIPGLDSSLATTVSQQALQYLVANKDKAISTENLSEISTDRLTAGLEIITPSVVTDALVTNSIGSSGSGDITFLLDAHSKLVVKGRTGGQAFSIDATGNAVFGVSLVTLGDIESKGGLTVDGDALFNGIATFTKLAQFQSDIDAQGRVTFNKDAGGTALIAKGGTRVDVVFDKPYDHPPIVSITLLADQVTLPDGTIENSKLKEQRLFNAGYSYLVSSSSSKGFTIVLNKKAAENLQFSWNAVAIKDPTTTTGSIDTTENQSITTTDLVGGQ